MASFVLGKILLSIVNLYLFVFNFFNSDTYPSSVAPKGDSLAECNTYLEKSLPLAAKSVAGQGTGRHKEKVRRENEHL